MPLRSHGTESVSPSQGGTAPNQTLARSRCRARLSRFGHHREAAGRLPAGPGRRPALVAAHAVGGRRCARSSSLEEAAAAPYPTTAALLPAAATP